MPNSGTETWSFKIHLVIATVGGSGFLPFAPGTWGSAVAAGVFWFMAGWPTWLLILSIVAMFLFGVWNSAFVETQLNTTDPGFIVIDELVGMWISLLFVPQSFVHYLFAIVLFRIFDIVKIPPAKQLQDLGGGLGIMLDDVAAGIYALIIMHLGLNLL